MMEFFVAFKDFRFIPRCSGCENMTECSSRCLSLILE